MLQFSAVQLYSDERGSAVSPAEIIFGCGLTRREVDVSFRVAEYKSPAQIAMELSIQRRSVYRLEKEIREKLEIKTRVELIQRLQPLKTIHLGTIHR